MATRPQAQIEPVRIGAGQLQWSVYSRIAFRVSFLYFLLYCLTNQIILGLVPISGIDIPDLASLTPIRQVVFWAATHLFGISSPLVYKGSGSGDKTFDWVLVFCILCTTVVAAAVWSVFDRERANYTALHKWFHVFLRFAVGSTMVGYGMLKVVPLQMPFPFLTRLVEPFGNFSPMGVLWYSIGASPAYERFVGSAEMLGGILLFIPRTSMLGALVCFADATEVFMLNMTYDVPVKLLSFHLILMSVLILAPELPRMARFFLSNREVGPSKHPDLFHTPRANRIAVAVQIVFGLVLMTVAAFGARENWYTYGGGAPKSPLYGIWNVEQFSIDGAIRPALILDNDRWRRVIFDRPNSAVLQRTDDSFINYGATVNTRDGAIALTKPTEKNWKATLRYQRIGHDEMTLEGRIDGHSVRADVRLLDQKKFLLVNRGFHWIQEYPFNR